MPDPVPCPREGCEGCVELEAKPYPGGCDLVLLEGCSEGHDLTPSEEVEALTDGYDRASGDDDEMAVTRALDRQADRSESFDACWYETNRM